LTEYVELFANHVQEGLGIQRPGWMVEKVTQTVAVDFDGVIHAYSKGWHDGTIYDEPMPGAIEGLRKLQERYAVFVFTSRRATADVAAWINRHALGAVEAVHEASGDTREFWNNQEVILVTNRKLPAVAYIDDRAVPFTTWDYLLAVQMEGR
jgi:hypothetical protein